MIVKVIEAKEDKITIPNLLKDLKKNTKIDYCGAIFTFEGIVRGKEENMDLEKLILTTPDKEATKKEIEKIVENVKIKYNVVEILKEVIEKVKYDVEFEKEEISKQGTKTILAGG